MCLQNVVPDQPAGACAVVFSSANQCFSGYVLVPNDPNLPGPSVRDKDESSSTAIIVPVRVGMCFSMFLSSFQLLNREHRAGACGRALLVFVISVSPPRSSYRALLLSPVLASARNPSASPNLLT